jgi:hypothetical protein
MYVVKHRIGVTAVQVRGGLIWAGPETHMDVVRADNLARDLGHSYAEDLIRLYPEQILYIKWETEAKKWTLDSNAPIVSKEIV